MQNPNIHVLSTITDTVPSVAAVIQAVAGCRCPAVLDSADTRLPQGRYTIVARDPIRELQWHEGGPDPFEAMRAQLSATTAQTLTYDDASSCAARQFPGGWIGYFAYEAGRYIESLPAESISDVGLPVARFALYDSAAVHDAHTGRWAIVAADLSAVAGPGVRRISPQRRIDQWRALLAAAEEPHLGPAPGPVHIKHNMSRAEYAARVQRAVEYIAAGDVFQVNLARRESWISREPAVDTYLRLRQSNPAAYAAFLSWPLGPQSSAALLSSSPELFLQLTDGLIITRPIKGTRPRGADPVADAEQKSILACSPKDRAELAMIVDLERNDLGRVAEYGSVRVTASPSNAPWHPYEMESHATVHHLVGEVVGRLAKNHDAMDLIRACFPGGSITGAPKVRAMQIIDELEPNERSVYTGSIGYIGLDGNLTFNIAIRTLIQVDRQTHLYTGGGIVADSDPDAEFHETQAKALGMQRAVGCAPPGSIQL